MIFSIEYIARALKDYYINPSIPKEFLEFKVVNISIAEIINGIDMAIFKHVKMAESINDWCLHEVSYDIIFDSVQLVLARIKQPKKIEDLNNQGIKR